jgi:mannosyltransferase
MVGELDGHGVPPCERPGRRGNSTSQMPLQREFLRGSLTLILIVALAAALRLYGLEIQSLCNDELSSWTRSHGISLIRAIAGAKDDVHPPLHHIVTWLVLNYAGDDALYLRLPSAIFGILAVYRVYFLARDAYDHRAGLFAAATLAVSYSALFFSQEARVYSLVALLTVLSTHAALHWAQALSHGQRPPSRVVVRLCLWSILLIYAHYFGILTVAAQALVLFILCFARAPSRLGSLILGYLVIAVSYLPWLPTMLFQLGLGPGWIMKPGPDWIVRLIDFASEGIRLQVVLAALLIVTAAVHALRNVRSASEKVTDRIGPASVLISVVVLPPILSIIMSHSIVPVFTERNLIGVLPVTCAIVGMALSWGFDASGSRLPARRLIESLVLISLIVVSLFSVIVDLQYYRSPNREEFREAVNTLVHESRSEANPKAAFCAWNPKYFAYYASRANWRGRFDPRLCSLADLDRSGLQSDDAPDELWLIWGHIAPDPLMLAELQKRFSVTPHGRYLGTGVYHLKRRVPP